MNVFRIFREYFYAKRELARMLTQIYPGIRPSNSLDGLVSQVDEALAVPALQARTAQLLRRYESEPDEPNYNCGRIEGHADVCAQLRAILDPENVEHLSLDGLLEAIVGLREQAKSLRQYLDWYTSRLNEMQVWQRSVPEPYRTECCDILANGKVAPWRTRTETNE